MTDATVDDIEGGGGTKKKMSGKKLILFVALPAVLLLAGGGAAAFFLLGGAKHDEHGEHGAATKVEAPKEVVFFDLPEMLVNLNTAGRQTHYLKLQVALELNTPTAVPQVEKLLPRVVDGFQVFLRELRLEDLNGSTGMMRLKEELLIRINAALPDVVVEDVLFKEMLVQ